MLADWCSVAPALDRSTLLCLSPGFSFAPSVSVSLIDKENLGHITAYTESWQRMGEDAAEPVTCSVNSDLLND